MRRINESLSIYDINPEMKEAFDAVIKSGLASEDDILADTSNIIELNDWSAGFVRVRLKGDEKSFIYSFSAKKIIVSFPFDGFGENGNMIILNREVSSLTYRYCPVNRFGPVLGERTWLLDIYEFGNAPYYVGKDIFDILRIFNEYGKVFFRGANYKFVTYNWGIFCRDGAGRDGIIFDNDMNPILHRVSNFYDKQYSYSDPVSNSISGCNINIALSDGKYFIWRNPSDEITFIASNIDKFFPFSQTNRLGERYYVIKNGKYNILGRDYSLVVGDDNNTDLWFDDVKPYDSFSDVVHLIEVYRDGKKNFVSEERLDLLSDKWYDDAIPTSSGKNIGYDVLVATKDDDGCNLIDTEFYNYGKCILKEDVDDIKTSEKFIFAFIKNKSYVVWNKGALIPVDGKKFFPIENGLYLIETKNEKIDIASTEYPDTFCEKFMNGKYLDAVEIVDDDSFGIIEYNGKRSYINLVNVSPVFFDEDGSVKWFDDVEPAKYDPIKGKSLCCIFDNGKWYRTYA